MSFIHLHCHSNFSLLDGAVSIDKLVEKAKEFNMQALAITDHNALYGSIQFYQKAQEHGMKPIIGAEVILEGGHHTVLLAKNWEGYRNLCRIITEAHLSTSEKEPNVQQDVVARYAKGLICLSGCLKGEIPSLLLKENMKKADEIARCYAELFGQENFYIELQWTADIGQRKLLRQLVALAKRLQLPVVATNNVHFLTPEDHLVHRTLTSVRTQTTLAKIPPDQVAPKEFYFKTASEMGAAFREIPEAVTNTQRITDRCHVRLPSGKPIFPRFDLPQKETASSYLRKLSSDGLKRRYPVVNEKLRKRLEYELSIIDQKGFTEYFLIVWDIVQFAQLQDIPSVGRGSAACSLVAYALGISDVDPMRYRLSFERFLNPSRSDPPDIDLDLCWRRRDEVLEYVYSKYGSDRVAMICTYATLQLRSAFREVAKVFGLPPSEIDRISKRLPFFGVSNLSHALRQVPECKDIPFDQEPYRTIFHMSERLAGFPRHLGIHCGGIVIGREPLPKWVPLERATKGIVVTQYDMHSIEVLGLVKIDLLGQRALTIVADTVKMIEENYGIKIRTHRIPEEDERTANLIRRGLTLGCFQIESPGMRSLLQQMEAGSPEDVIVGLSLIRPGPAEAGMKDQYVRYRRGLDEVKYLHPKLQEVLGDTYGILLYQEDILKVANAIAGLTLVEADGLRRAVTKKRSPKEMAKNKNTFMTGAMGNGVSISVAEKIWQRVANFAAYSFCKAHAATYGQIAYQCCYLKAHYPAEFLASVLTNQAGYYPTSAYVEEARRWGIKILPPDVNQSKKQYTAREKTLRVGLMQVKDLANRTLQSILTQRSNNPFLGLDDFCWRIDISRQEIENLIKCGAMDGFGKTRPELFWELHLIYEGITVEKKKAGDATLFSLSETFKMPSAVPRVHDYPDEQKIQFEKEVLGLTVTCHPLTFYRQLLIKERIIPSMKLHEFGDRRVKVAGQLVTSRRAKTSDGKCMKFLTLEDEYGTFEAVLFPDTYKKYGMVLTSKGPFLVHGTVRCQYGSVAVIGEKIKNIHNIHEMKMISSGSQELTTTPKRGGLKGRP